MVYSKIPLPIILFFKRYFLLSENRFLISYIYCSIYTVLGVILSGFKIENVNIEDALNILKLSTLYLLLSFASAVALIISQFKNREKLPNIIDKQIQNLLYSDNSNLAIISLSKNINYEKYLTYLNYLKDLELVIQYLRDKRQDREQVSAKFLPFLSILLLILIIEGVNLPSEPLQNHDFLRELGVWGLPSFLVLVNSLLNFFQELTFRQELHYYRTQLHLLKRAQHQNR